MIVSHLGGGLVLVSSRLASLAPIQQLVRVVGGGATVDLTFLEALTGSRSTAHAAPDHAVSDLLRPAQGVVGLPARPKLGAPTPHPLLDTAAGPRPRRASARARRRARKPAGRRDRSRRRGAPRSPGGRGVASEFVSGKGQRAQQGRVAVLTERCSDAAAACRRPSRPLAVGSCSSVPPR